MCKKLRIIAVLIFIISAVVVSSGCWDALAINDRDICTAVVMDKSDGMYHFYVEIVQLETGSQEQGGTGAPKTAVVEGSGYTLIEARNDLDKVLNKPIFLGAVPALIVTRSAAEEGIEEYFYRIRDIQDYRKTMKILITSAKPEDILGTKPENSETIGFAVDNAFNTQLDLGNIAEMRLEDVLQRTYSTNDSYILNNIGIENGHPVIYGYSVFHGGKDLGAVPVEDCKPIAYLEANMSKKPRGNYVVPYDNAQLTIEATCTKRDIKADCENGKITFTLNMGFDGLEMYSSSPDPITVDDKKQIKKSLEETITKEISDAIETSQNEFKMDYLEFSEYFRMAYPDAYDKMDWNEEFPKAQFIINVDVEIAPDKALDYTVKRESK